MSYTMEEFVHQARQRFLHSLTLEEQQVVLDQLPPEERLRGLSPEELLRGLSPEERHKLQDYLKTLH